MEHRFGPILFVEGEKGGRYPYCHSLYVEADKKIVIDPASDRGRLKELRNGPGVDEIWLSHYHEDHFMHLDLFEDRPFLIAEADAPALSDLELFMDFYGMKAGPERDFWSQVIVEQFHFRPRRPASLFHDGERIDLGGVRAEVILTPGHTPGHCSFWFPEQKLLFLGDYDLTRFGPWYGDAWSDIGQTITSVNRLRGIPASTWVVAHEDGVYTSDPGDLWDRYLEVIDERENKLIDFLSEPRTVEDIVEARIIYRKKREPQEFYDFGERAHMSKHLERLIKKKMAIQEGGRFRLL